MNCLLPQEGNDSRNTRVIQVAMADEGGSVNGTTPKGFLHPKGDYVRRWNVAFVLSCVISVLLLDPLFLYIPLINEEKKCIGFDKTLWTTAIVLRSVNDFIKLVHIILQFRTAFIDMEFQKLGRPALITDSRKIALRYLWPFNKVKKDVRRKENNNNKSWLGSGSWSWSWPYFIIDILVILPIPQVLMSSIFSEMRNTKSSDIIKLLNFVVLLQYVPRVLQIYQTWKKLISSDEIFETTIWFKAALNLFLYLLAGHVLGAFWYFFSTQRVTACWHISCKSHMECVGSSFNCDHSLGNHSFLNDFCPITKPNATIFDFGIFVDALQSGVAESHDFPQKLFYCFWWGMQNLSSLGQNLRPSNYVWENLFALSIAISGLFLFLYIVGTLQIYLLVKTSKSEEIRGKMKARKRTAQKEKIKSWITKYDLPKDIRNGIMDDVDQRFKEDEDVYLEKLLPDLRGELQNNVKRHICLKRLETHKIIKKIGWADPENKQLLVNICNSLKPLFYDEHCFIVREGEPIDAVFLITDGVAWTYTSGSNGEGTTTASRIEHLEKDDFFGEELLDWVWPLPMNKLSSIPTFSKTLKTHTKVEAFALTLNDLRQIVYSRFSRLKPEQSKIMAANRLQQIWLNKHPRQNVRLAGLDIDSIQCSYTV